MKTMSDIYDLLDTYPSAERRMRDRIQDWENIHLVVKDVLEEVCSFITKNNDYFKNNLYTGVFPQGDKIVWIKSGLNPVRFNDNRENGFQIQFAPIANGKILVVAFPHYIDNKSEARVIDLIEDPKILTKDKVFDLVFKAIEAISKTSYLFQT